jgi:A/G-specific adenine glycosylase
LPVSLAISFVSHTAIVEKFSYDDFSKSLLTWYAANKRPMPWRDQEDDPYAVWVSEIMLQQTTVAAVIGFFNRWMERFPTVQSLADAHLDDVLKQWAGLGYYARARNLKKAAEIVVRDYDGQLPSSVDCLTKLPGIGRYTAGAISSIAFQLDAPLVDVNVIRVLCRVHGLLGEPTSSVLSRKLWKLAEESIPHGQAREHNQAVMELGARICLPMAPLCASCPVAEQCTGFQSGEPTKFPRVIRSKDWFEVSHVACFVVFQHRLLIVQRPLGELWGGLWEFPRVELNNGENPADGALRAVRETVGLSVSNVTKAAFHKHVVTNRKVSLHGYTAIWNGEGTAAALKCLKFKWVLPEELERYAISSPQLALLARWAANAQQKTLAL